MRKSYRGVFRYAAVLAIVMTLAIPAGASWQQKKMQTIWDGVYTAEQAARGHAVYRKACVYCHKVDLSGGSESGAPGLAGPGFLARWENKSVVELFATIVQTMPKDGRDSGGDPPVEVSLEEYLDVVAYILSGNGAPEGPSELPDDERLEQILITSKMPPK